MIEEVARDHPEAERVELWFMDEARVGQKGGLTRVWYQKGVRPRGVRQQGFASAYLFGAVCPGRGVAIIWNADDSACDAWNALTSCAICMS